MRCKTRGQGLLGATATILVSLALTTLLDLASAAPQQPVNNGLARRAYEAPGLGVELEINKIVVGITGKTLTSAEREKIKGAEMVPEGFTGAAKTDWQLTSETALGNDKTFYPEAIVNGVKNKVGGKKTKVIGGEIHKFFTDWAPCRNGDKCKVKIHGFPDEWPVQWPKDAALAPERLSFSPQVTTAMPLGALLEILKDAQANPDPTKKSPNPLSGRAAVNAIIILKKEDFKDFKEIKQTDITDDFLGFFSLLTAYCVAAKGGVPREGPKSAFSVMPRTDFVTQYTHFVKPKLDKQLISNSLTEIIEKVSKNGEDLAAYKFKWKAVKPLVKTPTEKWDGMEADLEAGTLEVGKFLNYLQGHDKKAKKDLTPLDLVKIMDSALRHGQIGALGNKMELILGTQNPAPIFEFRDLDPVLGAELATGLGAYEDKVEAYHKAHAAPHKREEPSAIEN